MCLGWPETSCCGQSISGSAGGFENGENLTRSMRTPQPPMRPALFPPERDVVAVRIVEVRELAGGIFLGRFGCEAFGFQGGEAFFVILHAEDDRDARGGIWAGCPFSCGGCRRRTGRRRSQSGGSRRLPSPWSRCLVRELARRGELTTVVACRP